MPDDLLNGLPEKTKISSTNPDRESVRPKVPVLIVGSAEEIYAIPQIKVSEIIRAQIPGTKRNEPGYNDRKVHKIEIVKGAPVIRLRGKIMPLVSLSETLGVRTKGNARKENLIIVCDRGTGIFGILVDKVLHIEKAEIYSGGAILDNGNNAMMIDPDVILKQSGINIIGEDIDNIAGTISKIGKGAENRKHILLVDDSAFFRKFMKPVIIAANYRVSTARDGLEGLELLKKQGKEIDIVITDIDTPEMSGAEFVKAARSDPKTAHIPFVALTSNEEAGFDQYTKEMGFIDLLTKSNRNKIVSRITEILKDNEVETIQY